MPEISTPTIYTRETIVFASGVTNADITIPVFFLSDSLGNHLLTDGNHRAYRAHVEGTPNQLPRKAISTVQGDISKNPDCKPISELKVIAK